jgi:hypothetical protein
MINIQSTLCTAPDLYKNVSQLVLFGGNSNSYTVSAQSGMCIYTHILHNINTLVGQKKQEELGRGEYHMPSKSFRVPYVYQP